MKQTYPCWLCFALRYMEEKDRLAVDVAVQVGLPGELEF